MEDILPHAPFAPFHALPFISGGVVLPALRPQEARGAHRPAQHWPPRAEAAADAGRGQVHRRHPTYVMPHTYIILSYALSLFDYLLNTLER